MDHDSLIKLIEMVNGVEKKIDSHAEAVKNHFREDKDDFEKVHKRINKLSWYAGLLAGVVFALEFFKEKIFR